MQGQFGSCHAEIGFAIQDDLDGIGPFCNSRRLTAKPASRK
jgi:hypothetical protein